MVTSLQKFKILLKTNRKFGLREPIKGEVQFSRCAKHAWATDKYMQGIFAANVITKATD